LRQEFQGTQELMEYVEMEA